MSDLDMLKAITDKYAEQNESGDYPSTAEEAVGNVLRALYECPPSRDMWNQIYEAIKSAYVGSADWGDEDDARS